MVEFLASNEKTILIRLFRLVGKREEPVNININLMEDLSGCDTIIVHFINLSKTSHCFHLATIDDTKCVFDIPIRMNFTSNYKLLIYVVRKEIISLNMECYRVFGSSMHHLDPKTIFFDIKISKNKDHIVHESKPNIPLSLNLCGISEVLSGFDCESSILFLKQIHPPLIYVLIQDKGQRSIQLPTLQPVSHYEIVQFKARKLQSRLFVGEYEDKHLKWFSNMGKKEIAELFDKAAKFNLGTQRWVVIRHIYRNKFEDYFNHIFQKCGGVMHAYTKNYGGDQGSSINGRLPGLFFSTYVSPKEFRRPDMSYFGDIRLILPVVSFFQNSNMYFADFYCHNIMHKVQLVLTTVGSQEDLFCQKTSLLPISILENPFFKYIPGTVLAEVRNDITVELFITGNINIPYFFQSYPADAWMERTHCIGNAFKMIAGIPKREDCDTCNLEIIKQRRLELKKNTITS